MNGHKGGLRVFLPLEFPAFVVLATPALVVPLVEVLYTVPDIVVHTVPVSPQSTNLSFSPLSLLLFFLLLLFGDELHIHLVLEFSLALHLLLPFALSPCIDDAGLTTTFISCVRCEHGLIHGELVVLIYPTDLRLFSVFDAPLFLLDTSWPSPSLFTCEEVVARVIFIEHFSIGPSLGQDKKGTQHVVFHMLRPKLNVALTKPYGVFPVSV